MKKPCKKQWIADTHLRQKVLHVCALQQWHGGRCQCFCRAIKTPKATVEVCLYWSTRGAGLDPDQFEANGQVVFSKTRQIDLEGL